MADVVQPISNRLDWAADAAQASMEEKMNESGHQAFVAAWIAKDGSLYFRVGGADNKTDTLIMYLMSKRIRAFL